MCRAYQLVLVEWMTRNQSAVMKSAVIPDWLPGPSTVETQPLCVDVWQVDLRDAADAARAHAHSALHEILARYLPAELRPLQIARSAGGKPYLSGQPVPLYFNLSHCRDLALIAVSASCELGIDVERARTLSDPLRLARRVCDDSDVAALEPLPPERQLSAFFDLWTRLEARQKAWGRGIFATRVDRASVHCTALRPTPQHHACVCGVHSDGDLDLRYFHFEPLA